MIDLNIGKYDNNIVVKVTLGIAQDEQWLSVDEARELRTSLISHLYDLDNIISELEK